MRKQPRTIIIFLLIACISATSARAEKRGVSVGVYENMPKIFTSEDGRPSGLFVDIIEHIARQEGWELRYVPGTWAEGLERLAKGQIDLMPDVAYTAERGRMFGFHKVPVLSSWSQVYARKNSGIHSILDLNGKRIAVLKGSVQQNTFERFAGGFGLKIHLVPLPDYKTMFDTVARGVADAAVTNRFYGLVHAGKSGLEDTAVLFDPSELFFASTASAPPELLNTIDVHLSVLKKEPGSVYYRSLKRWTSEEVGLKFPFWVKIVAFAAGIFLMVSIAGSAVLKHQVNARTKELRAINSEMEERIRERTAELAVAMEQARAADRIKSAFLASMSHELRTPLNSIIGFTGIILQKLAGPLTDEQEKQMRMVSGSAQHLLSLINDVLDISKIEAGQLEVYSEPFNARESIEKVLFILKPLADKKGLDLVVSVDPQIGELKSDRRRVEQVLLNLMNNAIKFTEEGVVTLSADILTDYRFSGGTRKPGASGAMRFAVSDTGIGIRPEDLKDLFQAFRQIDSGLTRRSEGTGLGLAICRKLAGLLGGEIIAESELGRGSVFTFIIPFGEDDA
jgi:signal transduction histidine kinase